MVADHPFDLLHDYVNQKNKPMEYHFIVVSAKALINILEQAKDIDKDIINIDCREYFLYIDSIEEPVDIYSKTSFDFKAKKDTLRNLLTILRILGDQPITLEFDKFNESISIKDAII